MTRVIFDRAGPELRCEGHAGAAPLGQDLVCAAESILLYTLLDYVGQREALMHPQVWLSPGRARILCRPEKGQRRRCRELMEAIFRGFELLEQAYPLCVETRRGGG